ncbi:Fe-S cluster assembly protein SufD [Alteromonas aestuariivivens]|uniref:Fe-S cluster assembly protein SufD n=1 Tax=Alteromonas aestuariivivens TaxID=1938339 RepID=A0A3D8MF86_9ALTE|nr:Fe-S cluster assembly protein SufD [Alteromonas aestuariivivens]RDV29270.1 Fe-S cluster assembly protein SufD [Alteromonas aestuariivivens]
MSQWLSQVIDEARQVTDYLEPVRQQAIAKLQQNGWPGRRNESWRFTPLSSLEKRQFQAPSAGNTPVSSVETITGLNAIELVFVNGELVTNLAALSLPEGLTITSLAPDNALQQQAIAELFGSIKPGHHVFGLVNDALCQQGVYVDVAAGAKIEPVIRIINQVDEDADTHNRILVRVGEGASVRVMEQGEGSVSSVSTLFAEYCIADNAHLEHYRMVMFSDSARHIGGCHFKLHNASSLNSTLVGYGSELSRLDVDVIHAGEHANAKLNAIYLLAEGELFDLHTTIEHAMPNGTTEENARGIVGDRARAVFNGRIHIHRDAQKTLAELNNRNLLLSRRALINTKPELEIYADDVKCAHGATVAEIEEKALYYLMTRGISRSKALVMLNFGFIQELVNQIPNKAISEWLLPKLSERFLMMEVK